MRPCDVILAFWFSCVYFFFSVDSQSCTPGWFGSKCQYKCRCAMNSCDTDGQCTGSKICQGGWFGPRCQYVDLVYNTTAVANKLEATDGLDSTCVPPTSITTINITLTEPIEFAWMRVVVTQLGSDHLINSLVTFYLGLTQIPCPEIQRYLLGTSILDVQCNLTQKINQVTLEGGSVDHLCSVYISGGRNVALLEYTNQSTTYFQGNTIFFSNLSVDGNTNPYLVIGKSCSSTWQQNPVTDPPKWTVIFSKPRHIYKYVIYNRREQPEALIGVQVLSYSQPNHLVSHHIDNSTSAKELYTFWHNPLIVSIVTVTLKNAHNWVSMCEVEIYGDSICDAVHYGLECEQPCKCPYGEACFVATGACPECPFGFEGKGCLSECNAGSFGFHCNSSCSQTCKEPHISTMSPCHRVTGNCITGCKSGFLGPFCKSECPVGSFGDGCNSSCSVNCEAPDNTTMSPCDHVAGKCLTACMPGYAAPTCEHECPVGSFGDGCNSSCSVNCEAPDNATKSPCDHLAGKCSTGCKPGYAPPKCEHAVHATGFGLETIIGLCLLAAIALFVGFCLIRRKKKEPLDETEHESAHPEN